MVRHLDGTAMVRAGSAGPPLFREANRGGETEGFDDWKPVESYPEWLI